MTVKLLKDAYATSGTFRLPLEDGTPSIYVLDEDGWYEATAEDEDENQYLVIWAILDPDSIVEYDDESCACDWDHPSYVISIDDWCDVTNLVESVELL